MVTKKILQSIRPLRLNNLTKGEILSYFENTWSLNELLFSSIKNDDTFYLRPDPLRNPLVFYLGHTAAFYINKFKLAGLIENGVNEKLDHLFAVGVDPDLPQNLNVSAYWPTIPKVRAYRRTIYNIILEIIDQMDWQDSDVNEDSPLWAIMMALEHDRIHFETSSMLIRQLDANLVECPNGWKYAPTFGNPPENEWISSNGDTAKLGKPKDSDIFGWDNEYGALEVEVKPFQATKNLITNSEFWDFVNAGGYENEALWTVEGWEWKERTKTCHPRFWIPKKGTFHYRAMFDEMPMPMDWPVEVNAHEAQTYCNWKNDGSRLLSEAEFVFLAMEGKPETYDPVFTDDYNLDFLYGSPTPVGYMKKGTSAAGFNDLYGNVWDWLKDDFYPLPGFKVHPYYEDFSVPFMDSEHSMMVGGSWITTGTGASRFYRLWFRRHFFQHAGFRLAKGIEGFTV